MKSARELHGRRWIAYAAVLRLHTRPSFRGPLFARLIYAGFDAVLFCNFGVAIWIGGPHSSK
jgi:hypothetical protein